MGTLNASLLHVFNALSVLAQNSNGIEFAVSRLSFGMK